MKILMCRPDYYRVIYEINPWMKKNIEVDQKKAIDQWKDLFKTIQLCDAKIELIQQEKSLPDMVFTANAALIVKDTAYLSNFRYFERQNEATYFREWFKKQGLTIDEYAFEANFSFEGEGDALFAGAKLFLGYGFRTDIKYYSYLEEKLKQKPIYCELVDPYYYHLDTCFCPIDQNTALWWPQAFSEISQKRIRKEIDVIDVLEEEARLFCCNAVVLGKNIIIPSGCKTVTQQLEERGFTVFDCPMSEYIKAGGACKCLVLLLTKGI